MAKDRIARRRRGSVVSTRVRQAWETVTTALALTTGIYLILTTIDPTRAVLERYLGQLNMQGVVALVGIMLEVATIAVYQLSREVRTLRADLAERVAEEATYSVDEVLATLRRESPGRRRRQVEILGLTLNTTWPTLVTWLTSHAKPTGWRITLYCLDPDFGDGVRVPWFDGVNTVATYGPQPHHHVPGRGAHRQLDPDRRPGRPRRVDVRRLILRRLKGARQDRRAPLSRPAG